tara:strand:+ start:1296 stop:1466 length:171 start_codon:yes stop_codon:yes gene_type:complete
MTLSIYFAIIILGILLVFLAMTVIDFIAEKGEKEGIVYRGRSRDLERFNNKTKRGS